MQLKIIASGSSGNAYLLDNDREALIVECGVPFRDIKKGLGFNIRKVVGALITHSHKDHCKGVEDVLKAGICVYSSHATHEEMGTALSHRARFLHDQQFQEIGNFRVLPFKVEHDTGCPFGFIISHPESGNILFLTDSYYSRYTFSNLSQIIVEANHAQDILDEKLMSEKKFLRDRVMQSHMNIDTCKELLKANDLSNVRNIVLVHLSDSNSDEARFKREVQEVTGVPVHIGVAGMTIDFNKNPF